MHDRVNSALPEILAVQRTLIESGDRGEAVQSALARVGSVAKVDRVYVFEITAAKGVEKRASQRYEWCSAHVSPQIDNHELQSLPLRQAGYGRWLDELSLGTPIYGPIRSFPEKEKRLLLEQGIKSLLILPIFVDYSLWGFVGFDDCTTEREWTDAEIDLLITISLSLGIALAGPDPSGLDRRTAIYLGMINRLFEVHCATFAQTSRDHLVERTQARVRVLVQSYRYFSSIPPGSSVALPCYLDSLLPLFSDIWQAQARLELRAGDREHSEISLGIERSLDIAVTLSEVFAILSETRRSELERSQITIALAIRDGRAEIALESYDSNGRSLNGATTLDAMAQVLLRRIQERLRATIEPLSREDALFRISFPS